mgnify:CR=1 FL=1
MNEISRRDFLGTATLAAGGLLAGCAGPRVAAKRCTGLYRAALQHLGSNMWGDWTPDAETWAKSPEEAKVRPNPLAPNGKPSRYCNYLYGRDELWTKSIENRLDIRNLGIRTEVGKISADNDKVNVIPGIDIIDTGTKCGLGRSQTCRPVQVGHKGKADRLRLGRSAENAADQEDQRHEQIFLHLTVVRLFQCHGPESNLVFHRKG